MITTPALAAAFKLTTTCPVRRHEWRPPPAPASAKGKVDTNRRDALARRKQVRALLAKGLSQRTIAARLDISRTTVFNHVHALKKEGFR